MNQNEFFYGNGRGYDPPLWYSGYDENWILGRRTAPAEKKGKSKDEPKGVIQLKMSLCCEGCVEKVKSKLIDLDGVTSVECSTEQQKVTVRGEAKPKAVLAEAKKISSRAEIWKDEKKK